MAWGRQQAEWQRASSLMALQANINRNPKKQKKPFSGNDFNPYAPPPPPAPVLSKDVAIAHAEALVKAFTS